MDLKTALQQNRNDPSMLPSCLLTPETPQDKFRGRMTPCFETSPSSVFLTPPSSQEKAFVPKLPSPGLHEVPKLNFELEDGDQKKSTQQSRQRSPLLSEDRIIGRLQGSGKSGVDFVTKLLALNCKLTCQKICSYLEDRDLCRFASVCKEWRKFITGDKEIGPRWNAYLCERQKDKENCGSLVNLRCLSFEEPTRLPLSEVNSNERLRSKNPLRDGSEQDKQTPAPTSVCRHPVSTQSLVELRPCPKCTSPSNCSKTQEGHCQCQKCGLRFCSVCLRDTTQHATGIKCDGLPVMLEGPSRRLRSRKSSKDIVGSKKSKERVRRL